jgi:ATP-dependent DNA helicase DinG
VPGFGEGARWKSIARMTGIDLSEHSQDDWLQIEPARGFGDLSFVLVDPESPVPKAGVGGCISREAAQSVASVVLEAARHGERVLSLCCSYLDVDILAPWLAPLGDRLLAHSEGRDLDDLLRIYRRTPDAVLLSPAAWEGVNLPGLVPRLVICRLPFPPPSERLLAREDPEAASLMGYEMIEGMMRKLRQGLGRPIRSRTDASTVYIADPRFPLPREVGLPLGLMAHPMSRPIYEQAVPTRFRRSLWKAAVFTPRADDENRRRTA